MDDMRQRAEAARVAVEESCNRFAVEGRDPASALAIWYLINVERLDSDDAIDSVMDAGADFGLHGILVDDAAGQILLIRAERGADSAPLDVLVELQQLTEAAGRLEQVGSIEGLEKAGATAELVGLVERQRYFEGIASDYDVICVFVTSGSIDGDSRGYTLESPAPLELWDGQRLEPYVDYAERPHFIERSITLEFVPGGVLSVDLADDVVVTFGVLPAPQVAALPGIEDKSLFAQNVRLDLGRTRVNREIEVALRDPAEHGRFLTFHNGLTIISREVEPVSADGTQVRINGFSVVNGCQSAVAFFRNEAYLSPDLLIPVRIVRLGQAPRLADDITYRSNNQNSINLKDLRANDATQIHLKAQFEELFDGGVQYQIKRGEDIVSPLVIPNDVAAQCVLAFYNQEPWLAHRKFALFDERYNDVFSRDLSAAKIFLSYAVWQEVVQRLSLVEDPKIASYGLTAFVLVYLVGRLMRDTDDGRELIDDPGPFVVGDIQGVRAAIGRSVAYTIIDFNGYVRVESDARYFDYKSRFKSQTAVRHLTEDVVRAHQRARLQDSNVAFHFGP